MKLFGRYYIHLRVYTDGSWVYNRANILSNIQNPYLKKISGMIRLPMILRITDALAVQKCY